jgi:hypothetical protein
LSRRDTVGQNLLRIVAKKRIYLMAGYLSLIIIITGLEVEKGDIQ